MGKRIARGTVIGIFLGVFGAILIANALQIERMVKGKQEEYALIENGIIEKEDAETKEVFSLKEEKNPRECNSLEDLVLRFHVTANSDSKRDLELKYAVRDSILYHYQEVLSGEMTRDEIVEYLGKEIEEIKKIAEETIAYYGFDYPVKVYIAEDYFPTRQYGDMVFPAGNYQALRVDIGEAKGENFWCVLYPMMCYTIDTGAIISKEDQKELKAMIGEEEYERLFIKRELKDEVEVEIRFKFLEWLGL